MLKLQGNWDNVKVLTVSVMVISLLLSLITVYLLYNGNFELGIGVIGIVASVITFLLGYVLYENAIKKARKDTWGELRLGSEDLLTKIKKGYVSNFYKNYENPAPDKGEFKPSVVFTPCRRGATIANLMIGTEVNLPVFVGERVNRIGARGEIIPDAEQTRLIFKNPHWMELETDKYYQYIPQSLIDLIKDEQGQHLSRDEKQKLNLLIVDDFVDTGNSLKKILEKLESLDKKNLNLRTAVFLCQEKAACNSNSRPDFWIVDLEFNRKYYFPWGPAR